MIQFTWLQLLEGLFIWVPAMFFYMALPVLIKSMKANRREAKGGRDAR